MLLGLFQQFAGRVVIDDDAGSVSQCCQLGGGSIYCIEIVFHCACVHFKVKDVCLGSV